MKRDICFCHPVESAKLAEAAAAAEAVEIHRKTLESKSFINDEKIDSLDERIITAQGIALISTRNHEEAGRYVCVAHLSLSSAKIREHIKSMITVCGCGLGGGKTSEYLAWVAMEVSEMGDHGPGVGLDL